MRRNTLTPVLRKMFQKMEDQSIKEKLKFEDMVQSNEAPCALEMNYVPPKGDKKESRKP